ncbi:hypothetical protein [Wenzhouxiangella marina]|uniref:Uncharacterized protein n=1 Tax=Wenzhouxiangella marina TaxID=1579979 RepID=A0A0K0XTU5_9GAMM|nr:hypothetical protein [Wenzhouxiangella marina]AKS41103.1 hypothetical protein WM2015_722 [Wenzhouxiangella marina]MBB6087982.1 hypothetical protein [Wenzhouxiangella marina]
MLHRTVLPALALVFLHSAAFAFDLAAYRALDPAELRAAEARIHELLEPGTARQLREPRNAAERYLVARQQRLAAQLAERPEPIALSNGEQVQALFWPLARASRLRVDASGQARIECVPASAELGRELPDFRHGNPPRRPVR